MKQLETTFTLNDNTFTQVKRNDKAAMYRRETLDGQFVSFEVFAVRSKDETEVYPTEAAVNKWLYAPISEDRANIWFDRFTNDEVSGFQGLDPVTAEPEAIVDDPSLEDVMESAISTDTVETPAVATDAVEVVDPTAPEETPVVNVTPDGGATVTVAKVVKNKVTYIIPPGEFTANEFADANGLRRRKGIWGRIQNEIEAGRVVFVKQTKVGKGRPTSFYTATPVPVTV